MMISTKEIFSARGYTHVWELLCYIDSLGKHVRHGRAKDYVEFRRCVYESTDLPGSIMDNFFYYKNCRPASELHSGNIRTVYFMASIENGMKTGDIRKSLRDNYRQITKPDHSDGYLMDDHLLFYLSKLGISFSDIVPDSLSNSKPPKTLIKNNTSVKDNILLIIAKGRLR